MLWHWIQFENINECAINNGGCTLRTSFVASCPSGYNLVDDDCVDINECFISPSVCPSTVSTRLEATIARVIQRHTLKLPMVAALTLTSVKPLPRFVAPWSASTQKAASVADRVPVDRSPLKESVCVSGMNDEH